MLQPFALVGYGVHVTSCPLHWVQSAIEQQRHHLKGQVSGRMQQTVATTAEHSIPRRCQIGQIRRSLALEHRLAEEAVSARVTAQEYCLVTPRRCPIETDDRTHLTQQGHETETVAS